MPVRRYLPLILLLQTLVSSTRATSPCLPVLEQLNGTVQTQLLNPSDRESITKAFDSLPEPQALAKTFEIFVRARVRGLPDNLQEQLVKEALSINPVEPPRIWFSWGSHYNPRTEQIKIEVPERYRNSIVDYAVRAHEFEHRIQDVMMAQLVPDAKIRKAWRDHHLNETRFLEEAGAIQAEAILLAAVPAKHRDALIHKITADAKLDAENRDSWLRHLQNANLPLRKYLEAEWAAGRYSREAIEAFHAIFHLGAKAGNDVFKMVAGLSGVGVLSLGTWGVAAVYCRGKMRDGNLQWKQTKEYKFCSEILTQNVLDELNREKNAQ